MKIIDVIFDSACLLGLTDEQHLIKTITTDNEEQILAENQSIASFYNLIAYSIRELCTNYIPLIYSSKIQVVNKSYPLNLLENFIRVQNVYKNNEIVKFKVINRNLIVEEDGEYEVLYATYPPITNMFQELDFLDNYSPDAIVLGLSAYYALAHGMFEEFKELHERYVSRAESLKDLKIFELPSRRWE